MLSIIRFSVGLVFLTIAVVIYVRAIKRNKEVERRVDEKMLSLGRRF